MYAGVNKHFNMFKIKCMLRQSINWHLLQRQKATANKLTGYNLGLLEPQSDCTVSKVLHYFYSICHSSVVSWLGSATAEYCHGDSFVERGIISFSR